MGSSPRFYTQNNNAVCYIFYFNNFEWLDKNNNDDCNTFCCNNFELLDKNGSLIFVIMTTGMRCFDVTNNNDNGNAKSHFVAKDRCRRVNIIGESTD